MIIGGITLAIITMAQIRSAQRREKRSRD